MKMFVPCQKTPEDLKFVKSPLNRSTKIVRLYSLWIVMKVVSTKDCDVGRLRLFGLGKTSLQYHLQLCYSKKFWD